MMSPSVLEPFMANRFCWLLALLAPLLVPHGVGAQTPYPLPQYDLDVHLDVANHTVTVRERVTWTNPASRPADELVFNCHAHFKLPDKDVGMTAKMFEILRMMPGETLDLDGHAGEVRRVSLVSMLSPQSGPRTSAIQLTARKGDEVLPLPRQLLAARQELRCSYQKDNDCALVVALPRPVQPGETIAVDVDYELRLPQVQGRWGQWQDVTFLSNWLPVLAFYDARGWQPTPYIPWHQPFFNEAGLYNVRLTVPVDQKVAATSRVLTETNVGSSLRQIDYAPCYARDFAVICSARFHEYLGQAGDVRVSCLAFPEHEHYARFMVESACTALKTYTQWFGPYPYAQFTLVESFFGWHSNECAGLVMMDQRIFDMPHLASPHVDYLVAHETCHQWWYNVVGTNGYAETFMDEGLATYFAYRLMRLKYGKNDPLVRYPRALSWLPNVRRDDFRVFNLYGTLGRGEAGPTVQEIPKYDHLVNLYSMCYERGSKVVGMIEERLGSDRFFDFMRGLYRRYYFRILRVADFQRELEVFSGNPWDEFFRCWIYGAGMTDWAVEKVSVHESPLTPQPPLPPWGEGEQNSLLLPSPRGGGGVGGERACKVTVLLRQKAEYNEPTVLGFCLDGGEKYQVRVPIVPQAGRVELPDVPAVIVPLAENRVRVEITLPCRPTQVAVDPDEVLVDRNVCNNYWKARPRFRLTPLYTFLDENDLTNAHDRWNVIAGPWIFAPTYDNPFFTRSTRFGVRAGTYRTSCFEGGVYTAYRTDYRDFVTGADCVLEHWPYNHAELGMVFERRLVGTLRGESQANRGVVYARHVIDYSDSLYLPPFQYVEAFGTIADDLLPFARETVAGAQRFKHQANFGVHYHLNYLTPYWDAEGGFATDISYAEGVEVPGEGEGIAGSHQVMGQFTYVQCLPDGLGWFSDTRLAFHAYGALGLPNRVQYYALGGGELFRGFDLAQRQGNALWVGNVEWRVPLLRNVNWGICDRALEVRNVYGAAFCDVGCVYLKGRSLGGIAEAVGAGLRIDVSWFTFVERTILRFDFAQTVNSTTPPQFWMGIEHPF